MRIKKKFLQLTRFTVPHGTEDRLKPYLPKGYQKDKFGNYFLQIGESPTTMFTCHLDTACKKLVKVNHEFEGKYIKTDGSSILGADDKAGMCVILYMIEKKVPGLYYFFIGEEVGCIGSSDLSEEFTYTNITKVVSFDRRGTNSIITRQIYGKCCSNNFAMALSEAFKKADPTLNLMPDDTGLITDSAQFMDLITECTNISVGYYNEHTMNERQDIEYLSKLCRAVVKIDWESLPVSKPKEKDVKLDDLDLDFDLDLDDLDLDLDLTTEMRSLKIQEIEIESKIILEFLKTQDYNPKSISWDGLECYCEDMEGRSVYIGNREELSYFIDEL
jgi:hypothetical protein